MREILFKAKHKNWRDLPKEEWWVEGYYAMMGVDSLIRHYIVQNCAVTKLFKNPEDNMYFNDVEIDPETLCQYIGLKDKNGSRIWENDIVKCNKRKDGFEFYKVLWRKYYADFGVEPLEFGIQYPIGLGENEQDIKGCNYEVIGNIFDNPELLKGD